MTIYIHAFIRYLLQYILAVGVNPYHSFIVCIKNTLKINNWRSCLGHLHSLNNVALPLLLAYFKLCRRFFLHQTIVKCFFISHGMQARNYIRSLPPMKRKDFKQVFKGASPLGRSFFSFFFFFFSFYVLLFLILHFPFSYRFTGENS